MSWGKVAGALYIPNTITVYSRKLSGVTKAETSDARAVSSTCQYPLSRSNLLTYLAAPTVLTQSCMRSSESATVTEFTFLKSVVDLRDPSGFTSRKQGKRHADEIGQGKTVFQ